jgi:hypothetical protein
MTIDDEFYVKIGRMTVAFGELDFMVAYLAANMAERLDEGEPQQFSARKLEDIKSWARKNEDRLPQVPPVVLGRIRVPLQQGRRRARRVQRRSWSGSSGSTAGRFLVRLALSRPPRKSSRSWTGISNPFSVFCFLSPLRIRGCCFFGIVPPF